MERKKLLSLNVLSGSLSALSLGGKAPGGCIFSFFLLLWRAGEADPLLPSVPKCPSLFSRCSQPLVLPVGPFTQFPLHSHISLRT